MENSITQGYCKDTKCAYDVYTKEFIDEEVIGSINDIEMQINSLASGAPKGTYETVSELETANPETGVYLVTENGHIYSWTENGEKAIDLGNYLTSTVSTDKTLTQENVPADAKKVGDKFDEINQIIEKNAIPNHIKEITEEDIENWNNNSGGYVEFKGLPTYAETGSATFDFTEKEIGVYSYSNLTSIRFPNGNLFTPSVKSTTLYYVKDYKEVTEKSVIAYLESEVISTSKQIKRIRFDFEYNPDTNDITSKEHTTVMIDIPTKTSELTNDSAYATETYVKNEIANAQLGSEDEKIVKSNEKGLYSWKHDDMTTDYEYMAKLCDYLGLTEVYQSFKWNGLDSDVATGISYLKNNTKNNVDVGYLCGEASWYNTTDAQAHIDKIVAYNNDVGENAKITKFILDVEPWTLSLETSEWLNDYVNMITTTHTYANNNNLTFGLVTPFWIDTASKINNETVYKTIIDNCDEVHIMNYNRNTFDTAIDNEVAYCQTSNKVVYSIAEMQAPNDEYGVTENLTYYSVGLDGVNADWQELKDKYNYSNLNFAYHDYRAMKELIPTIPGEFITEEDMINYLDFYKYTKYDDLGKMILIAPNGAAYQLVVSDDGELSTTPYLV